MVKRQGRIMVRLGGTLHKAALHSPCPPLKIQVLLAVLHVSAAACVEAVASGLMALGGSAGQAHAHLPCIHDEKAATKHAPFFELLSHLDRFQTVTNSMRYSMLCPGRAL